MQKNIVLLGSGKTSIYLIETLGEYCIKKDILFRIYGAEKELCTNKFRNHSQIAYHTVFFSDDYDYHSLISNASLVISLLPVHMHLEIAKGCLKQNVAFFNASYLTPEIQELEKDVVAKGLFFLVETGCDPGIDHMSAKKIIDTIHSKKGKVTSFKSYCGALLDLDNNSNNWHYKFTWYPKNIILSGKNGAKYRWNNQVIEKSHAEVFNCHNKIQIPYQYDATWMPNKDSLVFMKKYDLQDCPTFLRATIRHRNFIFGWRLLVDLGLTDDSLRITIKNQTKKNILNQIANKKGFPNIELFLDSYFSSDKDVELAMQLLKDIGFLDNQEELSFDGTSADFLLEILSNVWTLQKDEKDCILMKHEIEFEEDGKKYSSTSLLKLDGEDNKYTAIAKTVGLPLAFAVICYLENKINLKGIFIPTVPEIYNPVLQKLQDSGILFQEEIKEI